MLLDPQRFLLHDDTKVRVDAGTNGAYRFSVIFADEITDTFNWYPDNRLPFKEAHRNEAVSILKGLLAQPQAKQKAYCV